MEGNAKPWTAGLTDDELRELDNAMSQGDTHKPGVSMKLQRDIFEEFGSRGIPIPAAELVMPSNAPRRSGAR